MTYVSTTQLTATVPNRMPSPFVPFMDVNLLQMVVLDAFGIAVISYVISLSIARIVAAKFRYQVGNFPSDQDLHTVWSVVVAQLVE